MPGNDAVAGTFRASTSFEWKSLSLLANLLCLAALIDAVSLVADMVIRAAGIRRMLHPVFAPSLSTAGGGTSNAEPMRPMGFRMLDNLLQNMHYPLQLLLYVLIACWLYQAVQNANARGAIGLGRPGRAATLCLTPGVNLIWSVFYLDRLWRASIDMRGWQHRSTPLLVPVWWMVWLASVISIRLTIYLGDSIERYIRFERRLIEHDAISLLALLLTVVVIQRVTQAQRQPMVTSQLVATEGSLE